MLISPLVSVIIPTYKNRGALSRAIESSLTQSYKNVEVIVVDDNGIGTEFQKQSEKLCKGYGDRVKYIAHDVNKNGSAARNTGIMYSQGAFIALLDDDDYFYREKIEKQVNYLLLNKEFDAVYCFIRTMRGVANRTPKDGDLAAEVLLMNCFLQTSSLMFKRESLLTINGFDDSFIRHQDYEMLLRFFKQGFKMGCVNEVLVEYGDNKGLNVPDGEKMEKVKQKYLSTFDDYIKQVGDGKIGFYSKVYAKHYMQVFLCYARELKMIDAMRVLFRYLLKRPDVIVESILKKIVFKMRTMGSIK